MATHESVTQAPLKRFHLFAWLWHLEECGNDIPYDGSYATIDEAIAAFNAAAASGVQDQGEIFETLPDGSLKLVAYEDNGWHKTADWDKPKTEPGGAS